MLKLALIVLAATLAVAPLPRHVVERVYSRGMYPMVQPGLTALSNRTSFAWFDAIVLVALAVIVVMWAVRLRSPQRRTRGIGRTLAVLTLDTIALAAVLYLWFLGAWGLNYQRQPLARAARLSRRADHP